MMVTAGGYIIPEGELRKQATVDGITHISTGIAVVRDGKVLVVRRAADDYLGGNYELSGGGVDEGETLPASISRELREETGLHLVEVLGMFPGFDYSTPKKLHVRQFNFLVQADGDVFLSDEHDEFRWVGTEEEVAALPTTDNMKTCVTDALELTASFN